jgi:phosphoglycolate phosphatase-like HAD superfamily hydrolase
VAIGKKRKTGTRKRVLASRPKSAPPEFSRLQAVVFDVEGTLVDNVFPMLLCWQEILSDYEFHFSTAELHHFCGLGSDDMLSCLLPHGVSPAIRKEMVSRHDDRFKTKYLPTATPLPGTAALVESLKAAELQIALATTADRETLDRYLTLMGCTATMFDVIACGDDADRTKPDPQLLNIALRRLSLRASPRILGVGDTPYDAEAAIACGITPVGVLTGYFSRPDLLAAGCTTVCKDAAALGLMIERPTRGTGADTGVSLAQHRAPAQSHS